MGKNLVVYFSATGTTERLAEDLAVAADADIRAIKPKVPYTQDDLDWMNKRSRSTLEMKDKSSRPAIEEGAGDLSAYDTIFLGFPIWWYVAPTIVNTYLESGDFHGKKIVLFATSGGSGFGTAVEGLKVSLPDDCEIVKGKVMNGRNSIEDLEAWVKSL